MNMMRVGQNLFRAAALASTVLTVGFAAPAHAAAHYPAATATDVQFRPDGTPYPNRSDPYQQNPYDGYRPDRDRRGGYDTDRYGRGNNRDQGEDSERDRRGYGRERRGGYDRDPRDGYGRDERRYGGQPEPAPQGAGRGGSYQRSCTNVRQQGSTLSAVCDNGRGRPVETSIDVNRCGRMDIGNSRGVLQCGNVRGSAREVY